MIKNGLTSAETVRELRREAAEIRAKAKEEKKDSYEQIMLLIKAKRLERRADGIYALFVRSHSYRGIQPVEKR